MVAPRVSDLGLLLVLKLKQYFGPVRYEPRRLILSVVQLGFLGALAIPWGFLVATVPAAAPLGGAAASASTALSVFFALGLLSAFNGGVTASPMELDFVVTSPIRPRTYLHASVLFQLVVVQLTTLPLLPLIVGFALGRGLPAWWVAFAFLGFEGFLMLAILASHTLGILVTTGGAGAKALVVACVLLLFLPVLSLVVPFPRYQELPLPSTLYISSLVLLEGKPTPFPWAPLAFAAYLVAAYAALAWAATRNFFPHMRANQALSFGGAVHPGALRGRLGPRRKTHRRTVGDLRPGEGSLPRILLRLQLLRLIRERGIVVALGSLLLVTLMPAVLVGPSAAGPQLATSMVLYTSLLGPMLTVAWNGSERPTLWIPLTAGPAGRIYFQALFVAFVLASLILPVPVLILRLILLGPPPAWQFAALPLIALGSCGLALVLALRTPMPVGASPGLGPVGMVVLPVVGSYLLSSPALLTDFVLRALGPLATAGIMAGYAVGVALGLWRAVGWLAAHIQA